MEKEREEYRESRTPRSIDVEDWASWVRRAVVAKMREVIVWA